jgi:hypothetical protein
VGDADALLAAAEQAYQQDRGWNSIEAAFGPLDDLEAEPTADQTPPAPTDTGSDSGPAETRVPQT